MGHVHRPLSTFILDIHFAFAHPSLWLHLVRLIGLPNLCISPTLFWIQGIHQGLPPSPRFWPVRIYGAMSASQCPCTIVGCNLDFVWNSVI